MDMASDAVRALAHKECVDEHGRPLPASRPVSPTITGISLWDGRTRSNRDDSPQHTSEECLALIRAEVATDASLSPILERASKLPEKPDKSSDATSNVIVRLAINKATKTIAATVGMGTTERRHALTPRRLALRPLSRPHLIAYTGFQNPHATPTTTPASSLSGYDLPIPRNARCLLRATMVQHRHTRSDRDSLRAVAKLPGSWLRRPQSLGAGHSRRRARGAYGARATTHPARSNPHPGAAFRTGVDHAKSAAQRASYADFYISPTHDIVHRTTPNITNWTTKGAAEIAIASSIKPFTMCVDTESFAVNEPVQVVLSTSLKEQVETIWPGEATKIWLGELANAEPQVMHITIGGYPRRDLLRALARNHGGPLENVDIFQYIEQVQSAQEHARSASASLDLRAFAKTLSARQDIVEALQALAMQPWQCRSPRIGSEWTDATPRKLASGALGSSCSRKQRRLPAAEDTAFEGMLPTTPSLQSAISPADLNALSLKITQIFDTLAKTTAEGSSPSAGTGAPPTSDPDLAAIELCQLTSTIVPLISDDVLFLPTEPSKEDTSAPYVLTYDFTGGFQGAPPWPMDEHRPLFAAIHNVQPGWSVGISINNKSIVQRNVSLIGLQSTPESPSSFDERTSQSRLSFDRLNPLAIEMQPPRYTDPLVGFIWVAVKPVLRYRRLRLEPELLRRLHRVDRRCREWGGGSKQDEVGLRQADARWGAPIRRDGEGREPVRWCRRCIGPSRRTSMMVHSTHYLGVRAGVGVDWSWATVHDAVSVPGVSGQVVRERPSPQDDFSLPLLLTWVLRGTGCRWRCRTASILGIAGGLDVLKVGTTRAWYAALVGDIYGFGLTVGGSFERYSDVSLPTNTVVPNGNHGAGRLSLQGRRSLSD